jgi:hypothetical protein
MTFMHRGISCLWELIAMDWISSQKFMYFREKIAQSLKHVTFLISFIASTLNLSEIRIYISISLYGLI